MTDGNEAQFVPFYQPNGKLHFSPDADPKEMRDWADEMVRAGIFPAAQLVRVFEFLRDGNRIKNHMGKAERWQLARDSLARAIEQSERFRGTEIYRILVGVSDQYAIEYLRLMHEALDAFHSERLVKVRESKSGLRQLKAARAALKELDRLENKELPSPIRERYTDILRHWTDQEALCAHYETPS